MKIYSGDRNFMKTPKKKTPIKDFLKKGTVKGIKFAGKTALSPLSLAFGAGDVTLKTVDDNILNDAKFNYHKSMIDLTKDSLEDSPIYELRELSALTFAVDSEKLPEIIKKMKNLIRDVNKVSSKGKYKDKVYQLNLSLFGLSK